MLTGELDGWGLTATCNAAQNLRLRITPLKKATSPPPPPPPKKKKQNKTKQNKTKQNKKKSEKTAFNGVVYMSAKREPDLRAREHYRDRRTRCKTLLSISGTRRMTHTNASLEY